MAAKIHPWKTRQNPDTGRYEVCIAGIWRSRQYAWQVMRRIENKCKLCGHDALKANYPYCRRCARAEAIRKTGKWNGAWEPGRRGCPPRPTDSYTNLLSDVKTSTEDKQCHFSALTKRA